MNNWYKIADQIEVHEICQYCDRVKSDDSNEWEEKEVELDLETLNASHGICDKCWKILEDNDFNISVKKVKQLSLMS